jgi:hypothetical protein
MADRQRYPATGDDTSVGRDPASPPRMPRWVKVIGIIVAALILLAVMAMVSGLGGSDHGPGRHTRGDTAPARVTAEHVPPEAAHR